MADSLSSLGQAAPGIGVGLGVLQTGLGIIQQIGAKKKINGLLAQEKSYQTPQQIFDILNATQSNAQQGYDSTTLNYLTNQTDQAFSSSIGAATRLGGSPNDLSALFGQKVNDIMKIGADNHQLNMQNFSAYLNAMNAVASNDAAMQKSKQDILKDKLQAAGLQANNATGNISGGLNTILGSLSAAGTGNLYNSDGTLKNR